MISLETLHFDNHFARLGSQFSSPQPPAPLAEPYLVSASPDVAALIDLDPEHLRRPEYRYSEAIHNLGLPSSRAMGVIVRGVSCSS